MRYGIGLYAFVAGNTDQRLRALDDFASRARMPDVVPVWVTFKNGRWVLDPALLRGIRERGAEPVCLVESTGVSYSRILVGDFDCELEKLAVAMDGCAARWDHEPMSKGLRPPWYRHPEYVSVFGYVSDVWRHEADVRLIYCTTINTEDMEEFYPGDEAVQIVAFDAFSRSENGRFPPEQWAKPTAELERIAPGKPIWNMESGRLVGLPRRNGWLLSMKGVHGVEVAIPWDMDVPDSEDDFTFTMPMYRTFSTLGIT